MLNVVMHFIGHDITRFDSAKNNTSKWGYSMEELSTGYCGT